MDIPHLLFDRDQFILVGLYFGHLERDMVRRMLQWTYVLSTHQFHGILKFLIILVERLFRLDFLVQLILTISGRNIVLLLITVSFDYYPQIRLLT